MWDRRQDIHSVGQTAVVGSGGQAAGQRQCGTDCRIDCRTDTVGDSLQDRPQWGADVRTDHNGGQTVDWEKAK